MGFLQDAEQAFCKESIPWNQATQQILGASSSSEEGLIKAISAKTTFADNEQKDHILAGLRWLGIFSSEKVSLCRLHSASLDVLGMTSRFSIRRNQST